MYDQVTGNELRFHEMSKAVEAEPQAADEMETGGESVALTGTWKPTGFTAGGVSVESPYMDYMDYELIFQEDGTVRTNIWGVSYTVEYTLEGNEIRMEVPQQGTIHIQMKDGQLELEDAASGGSILFMKENED